MKRPSAWYQRGFYLRNDYYNGINFAYLLNIRAADCASRAATADSTDEATQLRAEAVACFVDAAKVRREVLAICGSELATEKLSNDARYWVLATIAEACFGLGDHQGKDKALSEASALTPKDWMKKSTNEQLIKLGKLLSDSPMAFVDGLVNHEHTGCRPTPVWFASYVCYVGVRSPD